MRRSMLLLSLLALAALLLSAASARADHPHRRGRVLIDTPRVIIISPGSTLAHRPPGWDRGRKVGWGGCDLPPGLAKKYGCRSGLVIRDVRRHRFDRRFRRDSGVIIHVPGRIFLDLR